MRGLAAASAVSLGFALIIGVAHAQFGPAIYVASTSAPAGYQGPGDVLASAVAWYGLRAYSAAAAASNLKAIQVKSTAHSAETCDIGVGTNGFIGGTGSVTSACSGADNGISLSSFCTSNSDCNVQIFYDQSGNARNVAPGGAGAVLSISPLTALCTASTGYHSSGTVSIAQPWTVSYVAQRTSGTTFSPVVGLDGGDSQLGFHGSGQLFIYSGSTVDVAYSEGTQGAVEETGDGANSVVDFNGSSSTGLNPGTGSASAAVIGICNSSTGSNVFTGNFWEAGIWQGTAANHTNFPYASMTTNQRSASNGWNF